MVVPVHVYVVAVVYVGYVVVAVVCNCSIDAQAYLHRYLSRYAGVGDGRMDQGNISTHLQRRRVIIDSMQFTARYVAMNLWPTPSCYIA